jgi:uncharacterized protein (TIGR03437 family)
VKQAFRLSCVTAMFVLLMGAFALSQTTTTSTPDAFVTQITNSTRDSFVGDISANGRFVVIESNGDIATDHKDNADGNREIFLADLAQRRIFQITNTKSALRATSACPTPTPTPTPSPSPTPTPTPGPTPIPGCAIDVEVSNNQPVLSSNGRWIAFTSNAPTPGNFDGNTSANHTALSADGNQEIFIYFIPQVADPNADLSLGVEQPPTDLSTGTFTRITDTPASRVPTPGTATDSPFVAFDNREPSVNDNATVVAFSSTRNLVGTSNQDGNPEIFLYNRTANSIVQMTNTTSSSLNNPIFNAVPAISGQTLPGTVAVSFFSNANINVGGSSNNADTNGEVYLGTFDGATATVTKQVTRTTAPVTGFAVNVFSYGRRISRNGNLVAFESYSNDPKTNGTAQSNPAIFVYNVATDTFTQVGPRATSGADVTRFPTFTGDNSTLVFASTLNFNADGSAPSSSTAGLNPNQFLQVFSTPVPPATVSFTRLTNNPATGAFRLQPFVGNTRDRIAFTLEGTELGGGNLGGSAEAFYLLTRGQTDVTATLSFFTGASERPVLAASPTPTPTPTPPAVLGLAPGMLAIVRSTTPLAPSPQQACASPNGCASESQRRPPLPTELNKVTLAFGEASAGLYFVSEGQINFVVPPGLPPGAIYPVILNNNGNVIRTSMQVFIAQPDIFTVMNSLGSNRASVLNVTNPLVMTPEPFNVTSQDSSGATVPTVLRIFLTGVRRITDKSQVTVRIGTTDLTGTAIVAIAPTDTPGTDQIDVTLPAALAGAGDVPVIVSVAIAGSTFSSRPADAGAPLIHIN